MDETSAWVRIERDFDAPIETIWAMWTDPDLFASWYGPMGMSVPEIAIDLRVGGQRKLCMSMESPERSMKMWFTGVYKEISAPHRLVYTEAMCDEDGTLISPSSMGMPEGTPDITEVIIDLTDIGGRTRMTMIHKGVPEGSPGEGGWRQAFTKLDARLSA